MLEVGCVVLRTMDQRLHGKPWCRTAVCLNSVHGLILSVFLITPNWTNLLYLCVVEQGNSCLCLSALCISVPKALPRHCFLSLWEAIFSCGTRWTCISDLFDTVWVGVCLLAILLLKLQSQNLFVRYTWRLSVTYSNTGASFFHKQESVLDAIWCDWLEEPSPHRIYSGYMRLPGTNWTYKVQRNYYLSRSRVFI